MGWRQLRAAGLLLPMLALVDCTSRDLIGSNSSSGTINHEGDAAGDEGDAAEAPLDLATVCDPHDYHCLVLADQPLAYWRLNETVGTLFADATGHGYDASMIGAPLLGQDQAVAGDSSIAISGNSGAVVSKQYQNALDNLSLEAWVKTQNKGWEALFDRDVWDDPNGIGLYIEWQQGQVYFGHYLLASTSQASVSDNQWHHTVGTVTKVDDNHYTYTVYLDGAKVGASVGDHAMSASAAGIFAIGVQNGNTNYPLNGSLSEVAFYDRALTAAQILAHYQAR